MSVTVRRVLTAAAVALALGTTAFAQQPQAPMQLVTIELRTPLPKPR